MLSLPKHLYRTVAMPLNGAVEMLRQAQHDGRFFDSANSGISLVGNSAQRPQYAPDLEGKVAANGTIDCVMNRFFCLFNSLLPRGRTPAAAQRVARNGRPVSHKAALCW